MLYRINYNPDAELLEYLNLNLIQKLIIRREHFQNGRYLPVPEYYVVAIDIYGKELKVKGPYTAFNLAKESLEIESRSINNAEREFIKLAQVGE